MNQEVLTKFMEGTDDTGRFYVRSERTGRTYYVEPIGSPKTGWGDMDPATKKVSGSYGKKYRGSVDAKDSLITEENGFKNIKMLEPGVSPLHAIETIDAAYPDK